MNNERENKMGTWPENRLLLNMSVPIMISMLVQALYNVVDSYFVARLNEDALTAVTMAFPVQNLMIAVGVGVGVGMNALLSRSLGEKRQDKADIVAMQGLVLAFISYLIFLAIGLFGSHAFIRMQTDIDRILTYGTDYLEICCVFSFGVFFQIAFERLLQATGRTVFSMITQGVGAIVNIILDPILIFGYLGFPAMGVAGAAIATVIGQMVAAVIGLICNFRYNHDITLRLRNGVPNVRVLGQILYIGVPSVIMAAIGSVMSFALNKILMVFSSTAVAVFGVYFKLQSFVFMPVFGLNNGMVPIVAYNLGARKRSRIIKTIQLSALYATGIMLVGLIVVQLLPGQILQLFKASPQMLEIGIPAFRIISICFIFAGVSIVISSVCQAVGNSVYSMLVSIFRQLVVLVPAAYFLAQTGRLSLVWWAFPIAELVSVLLCGFFLKSVLRKLDF